MIEINLVRTIVLITTSFIHVALAMKKYDKKTEAAALELNREKWATYSGGTPNYNFRFERICFCPMEYLGPFNIKVRLGEIVAATYDSGNCTDGDMMAGLPTIEGAFSEIEDALDQEYDDLKVTYDDVGGFPTSVWYDYWDEIVDDEMMYVISNVQIINFSDS